MGTRRAQGVKVIPLLVLVGLALFLGYIIGVRRERGRHQLIAELEATHSTQRRKRSGIKLQSIRVSR